MNPSAIEHTVPASGIPEIVDNVYLPKVAVLDRVVSEINGCLLYTSTRSPVRPIV